MRKNKHNKYKWLPVVGLRNSVNVVGNLLSIVDVAKSLPQKSPPL